MLAGLALSAPANAALHASSGGDDTASITAPADSAESAMTAQKFPEPLPAEPVPSSESLPAQYPDSWVFVHDLNFNSLIEGRVAIVDIDAPAKHLMGTVTASQFGNFLDVPSRGVLLTTETFYSRLTRGERTDVITIWDKQSLLPKDEIILPSPRGLFVTSKPAFQLTNDDKWALVTNFTPASSVTVVDLDSKKALQTLEIPGCMMALPLGQRGFMTLCADGSVNSNTLDAQGNIATSANSATFNDIDNDPLFINPAMIGRTAWFATYQGNLQPIDLSGNEAVVGKAFSAGTADGADPQWRPGGWQVVTADGKGRLYLLMSPNGKEGSHKDGGSEVWIFDPASGKRTGRIKLDHLAVSIQATSQASPKLIAAQPEGQLDIYDPETGKLIKSIGGQIVFNPFSMTAVQP